MNEEFDAAVVGAGPAGSAAATVLAQEGRRVLLLEKDRFPRPKVCGEFLSADARPALDRLGVRERVEAAGPERIGSGAVHLPDGREVSFSLPEPAWGLSRFALDALLAGRAGEAGAIVRFGERVLSIERTGVAAFRILVATPARSSIRARAVVGAWGRWDALDRSLERGFLRRRRRFFGWSRDFGGETERIAGRVLLYLFPGGYCGLSRVEGGAANLAGVVSERMRRRLGGWSEIVDHARRTNRALDLELGRLRPGPIGILGTGPVFFTAKPPGEGGILMAGDAAGVIDPFSGEGQAAALAGGILAGEIVERALSGEIAPERLADVYGKAWRARFGRRFAWSAAFRSLALHPRAAALAGRLAGERLVRFAITATRR